MANALYDTARNSFLNGSVNWSADSFKVALIDTTKYTVNLSTDQYLSSISGISGAIVATSSALASTSSTAGVANAGGVTITLVTGATVGAMVIYKDTGSAGTSQLIAYIDTATGLPVTPNGGNIIITWDTGANKIFKL